MAVFQSTHPHGVRLSLGCRPPGRAGYFNPRTRMGCDRAFNSSIIRFLDFNPRTRVGCDTGSRPLPAPVTQFQSTHPRGVRLACLILAAPLSAHFNPRTRMGCDRSTWGGYFLLKYFNPRTRMGCDGAGGAVARDQPHFNPRTRMGCDDLSISSIRDIVRFQSTYPHGVRQGRGP